MKYCQKCGTENQDVAAFCRKCGTPFQSPVAPQTIQQPNLNQQQKSKRNKNKKKTISNKKLVLILVILCVVMLMFASGEDSGTTYQEDTTSTADTTETIKSVNKNVEKLMDATGYKEDVCNRIYEQLKKCGYENLGKLTEVSTAVDTKSYKVTGSYFGSGMIIVSENGLYYFSWGNDTFYDAEKPENVKNIKEFAVLEDDRSKYYLPTEEAIKKLLKSPSTAKFPAWYNGWNLSTENGIVKVSSYVDAQNSFGATVRSNFVALYRISDGHGIYLEFDGQVYLDER